MSNITLAVASRNVALDAILARLNSDTNPGRLLIYTGTLPTSPDTAPSGSNVLLASLALQKPSFASSASGTATLLTPVSSVTALATGTAAWFRLTNGAGVAVLDGTVGTSSAFALQMNTTSFASGVSVTLNSLAITLPTT